MDGLVSRASMIRLSLHPLPASERPGSGGYGRSLICGSLGFSRSNALKMFFVEHDHMVRALAPRRPDQALNKAVLPGRAEGRRPISNTHRSDTSFEHGAECSVVVANEILRCRVPWE